MVQAGVDPGHAYSSVFALLHAIFHALSSLLPSLGPGAPSWRRTLLLCTWLHLPSYPSSGSSLEAWVNRQSPEPRRPSDYISRCKQAGRSRARHPMGPHSSLSLPPSSLHQPFAAPYHHGVGLGSCWEAGAGWGTWPAP